MEISRGLCQSHVAAHGTCLGTEGDFDESREEVTRSGLEKLRKNREGGSRNIAKLKDCFFLQRFGSICVKEVGNYSGYP